MTEATKQHTDFSGCTHGQRPPCSCVCPFALDVREFMKKLRRGSFAAAFNLYRASVLFPEIVCQICHEPCREACARTLGDSPLDMRKLEQASIAYARSTDPVSYNLPPKAQRIAVLGADLAGVSCALKLAQQSYPVEVWDVSDRICPELEDVLPRAVFEPEILKQFRHCACQFHLGEPIPEALCADAVYVSFGVTWRDASPKVFRAEGTVRMAERIVEGIRGAEAIGWFLQTGNRRPGPGPFSHDGILRSRPLSGEVWSKAEARQESDRCVLCDCSKCMDACVMLRQYGGTPRDLEKDVGLSLNIFPETQGRAAMREIGSCNFCGLCKQLCPSKVDIGTFLLHSRTELFDKGLLPAAHHAFWMRDMDFSNGEQAALYLPPEGRCGYLFFPGCQAGGSDPRYVTMTYARLRAKYPGAGLLLQCCGVPALWAGQTNRFKAVHETIREYWKAAGEPMVLLSCPSCYRVFHDYLPEIPVRMIYQVLSVSDPVCSIEEASVFDPCASRDFPELHESVRSLIREAGIRIQELPYSRENTQCCSWGGHGYTVNPIVVGMQAREQAQAGPLPYITYCTNCRDILSSQGKECFHILDILNHMAPSPRKVPTVSQRRDHRRQLKRMLLRQYCPEVSVPEEVPMPKLNISPEVSRMMNEDLILEEDLVQSIEACQENKRYLLEEGTNRRVCHLQIGYITYWVHYSQEEDGSLTIHSAYAHRMMIKADMQEPQARQPEE